MNTDNHVLELAIFTVKPECVAQMPQLREELRDVLKDFPGLIEYHGYCPLVDERTFVDLAKWQNMACAEAVATAFQRGDKRFAAYMSAIENLTFKSHFAPEPAARFGTE